MSDIPTTTSAKPVHVTDTSFQIEVLQSNLPVVVDFWAAWCAPCRMIAPALEKLAGEFEGKAKIAKLNVDENPYFANRFQVQGIPTLLLFKNGQVAEQIVGVHPKEHLTKIIDKHL